MSRRNAADLPLGATHDAPPARSHRWVRAGLAVALAALPVAVAVPSASAVGVTATSVVMDGSSLPPASPLAISLGSTPEIKIHGSGFSTNAGLTTTVTVSGGGVTGSAAVVVDSTDVVAQLSVAPGATLGGRDVTVTQGVGGAPGASGTCTGCLALTAAPVISSINPPGASMDAATPLTISGTGFPAVSHLAVVAHHRYDSDVLLAVDPAHTSATTIAATVPPGLDPSTVYQIEVVDTAGPTFAVYGTGQPGSGFGVSGTPATVGSVAPAAVGAGQPAATVVLSGTEFSRDTVVTLTPFDAPVHSVTWTSVTQLSVVIDTTAAVAGPHTLHVSNGVGSPATAPLGVTAAPTVTAVSGPVGQGARGLAVTVTGANFATGVAFGFGPGVTGTVTSSTATTAAVALSAASSAVTGARAVAVTNPDGGTSSTPSALTVDAGPTVSGVAPASRGVSPSAVTLTVSGTNFATGTGKTFRLLVPGTQDPAPGITVDEASIADGVAPGQSFTVAVTAADPASVGSYDAAVTNTGDGGTGSDARAFAVTADPTVTAISRPALAAGVTATNVRLTGSGFQATPTVTFADAHVTASSVTYVNPTTLTLTVAVNASAGTGQVALTVTNPDGGAVTNPSLFTVDAQPTFTSVAPDRVGQNGTLPVAITGTGFRPSAVVTVSGSGITADAPDVSPTSLDVGLRTDATAATGPRTVTVTNVDDGGSVTSTPAMLNMPGNGITVDAAPTYGGASPAVAANTTSPMVTIGGSGLGAGTPRGARVSLTLGQTTIALTGVSVAGDGSTLSGTLPLANSGQNNGPHAPPGTYAITIVNADGGTVTQPSAFQVTATSPTVTAVTPQHQAIGAGGTSRTVTETVTGTNFAPDAAVTVSGGGVSTGPATISADGTTATVAITIAASAAPGARAVTVTDGNGQFGTLAAGAPGAFTLDPSPVITGVAPASVGRGATRSLTVSGTGLRPGAVVTASGSGLSFGATTVAQDGTSLTVDVSAAPDAATGARDLIVTHPDDGGTVTRAAAITVDAAPTVAGVSPSSRAAGADTTTITITGSGFVSPASVTFSDPQVGLGPVTVVSSTVITVDVTVDPADPPGTSDVTVTNPDGGSATAAGAFTVTAAPTVSGVAPPSLQQGAAPTTVQVTGTGFATGATLAISGPGITVGPVTVVDAQTLTAQVTVSANAPTGSRDLTVANTDGGTVTDPGGFAVDPAPITVTGVTYRDPATTSGAAPTARQGVSPTLVVAGTGFDPHATVLLDGGAAQPADTRGQITQLSATVVSPTEVDVVVSLGTVARSGGHTVTVIQPGGAMGTGPWTVTASSQARRFVAQVYRDMLGRDVDGAGWDYWSGRIDAGDGSVRDAASRSELVRQIEGSEEFLGTVVVDRVLFGAPAGGGAPARGLLKRLPDPAGHSYYLAQLRNGVTLQQERALVLGSAEYYMGAANGGGSPAQWVSAVYADVLGRAPSAGETSYWQGRAAAVGRTQAAYEVVQSDEGVTRVVSADYAQFLRRTTTTDDPQGRAYWRGQLQAGLPEQQFIAVLLGSEEYAAALR